MPCRQPGHSELTNDGGNISGLAFVQSPQPSFKYAVPILADQQGSGACYTNSLITNTGEYNRIHPIRISPLQNLKRHPIKPTHATDLDPLILTHRLHRQAGASHQCHLGQFLVLLDIAQGDGNGHIAHRLDVDAVPAFIVNRRVGVAGLPAMSDCAA